MLPALWQREKSGTAALGECFTVRFELLLLIGCVTWGQLLNFLIIRFAICKMETVIVSTLWGCYESKFGTLFIQLPSCLQISFITLFLSSKK
jgi:hypothetical protein